MAKHVKKMRILKKEEKTCVAHLPARDEPCRNSIDAGVESVGLDGPLLK